MSRPAILFADAADVRLSAEGEIFVRFWQGGTVVAVAGFSPDAAGLLNGQIETACRDVAIATVPIHAGDLH